MNCPWCHREIDSHVSHQTDNQPEDGDVCLCWACGKPAVFQDGNLRSPTTIELDKLMADPRSATSHGGHGSNASTE